MVRPNISNMHPIRKSLHILAYILAMFVAVFACNPTHPIPGVEAVPAPPVKCNSDLNCPDLHFCRSSVGLSGICASCVDCALQHRKPGQSKCAKGTTECGQCLPGFHDLYGQCSDHYSPPGTGSEEEFDKSKTNAPPVHLEADPPPPNSDSDSSSVWLPWVIGVVITVIVTGLACVIVKPNFKALQLRAPHRRNTNNDDVELSRSLREGDFESDHVDGVNVVQPTAPPEEYQRPPPVYSLPNVFVGRPISHLDIMNESRPVPVRSLALMAQPFNAGNGAGGWASETVMDFGGLQQQMEPEELPMVPNPNDVEMEEVDVEDVEALDEEEDVEDMYMEDDHAVPDPEEDEDFEAGLYQGDGRHRSQSASAAFDPNQSSFDVLNVSAGSAVSVATSSTDSGTGTGEEDSMVDPFFHAVPDLLNPTSFAGVVPDMHNNNEENGLHDNDVED